MPLWFPLISMVPLLLAFPLVTLVPTLMLLVFTLASLAPLLVALQLGAMWLETDRTNALILEAKPQPAGRAFGEKIVILAMPGSYLPTQSFFFGFAFF